jgi:ribose/xylose/arabinose/galactoside ABC-type transport system permease subunit
MIEGILVEGLLYGIMALGVFITFRILDFPDLSVDGTFPLGAAIMGISVVNGVPLFLALLLAFAGGLAAGAVTATIHNKLGVPNLLAGILTMTMLWSVNIPRSRKSREPATATAGDNPQSGGGAPLAGNGVGMGCPALFPRGQSAHQVWSGSLLSHRSRAYPRRYG